jgi:STIP1 family protein 1
MLWYYLSSKSRCIEHETCSNSYDRSEVLAHLEKIGPFDPLSRKPLVEKELTPNLALKEAIDAFLERNGWASEY